MIIKIIGPGRQTYREWQMEQYKKEAIKREKLRLIERRQHPLKYYYNVVMKFFKRCLFEILDTPEKKKQRYWKMLKDGIKNKNSKEN